MICPYDPDVECSYADGGDSDFFTCDDCEVFTNGLWCLCYS